MSDDNSPPVEPSLAAEFAAELQSQPTNKRVYHVAIQLTEPTDIEIIAERADCDRDTALRHARTLVDDGVLVQTTDDPEKFVYCDSHAE